MVELLSTPIALGALLMLVILIGELASLWSRAWVPSLLVSFMVYLGLMWAGIIDGDTVSKVIGPMGGVMISVVITHMGTMIPLSQIKEQWKAIAIALAGVVGIIALVLGVGSVVYDYTTAVSGTGVVAGGVVAFLLTSAKLTELGRTELIVIPALILGVQNLVGMPVANAMLRKYVAKRREAGAYEHVARPAGEVEAQPRRQLLPEQYQTPAVLLMLLFLLGFLGTVLDALTGLNYAVWALILGVIAQAIGLVPPKTMERANSFGLGLIIIIIVVLGSLNGITPQAVVAAIVPSLVILAAGLVGIIVFAGLAARLLKWDPLKGMPVALTALFGFPADYLLCQEISRSVGVDDAEREAIMDDIYTPMLIGGFTTVTISSVLVASVLLNTI